MILDKFRIADKTAVVTGGTKGIGKAVVLALAEAGADIAVVSRKEDQDIESAVLSLGRRYLHHSADLTQRKETRKVIAAVMEAMGNVDILVNNSGIIRRSPAADYSERDWDATLEIDLAAPISSLRLRVRSC